MAARCVDLTGVDEFATGISLGNNLGEGVEHRNALPKHRLSP